MFKIIVSPVLDEQSKVKALAAVTKNSQGMIGTVSFGAEPTPQVFDGIETLEAVDLSLLMSAAARVVLDEPGLIQIYLEIAPGFVPSLEDNHLYIQFQLPDSPEALLNRLR